jgi:hypothetical protein
MFGFKKKRKKYEKPALIECKCYTCGNRPGYQKGEYVDYCQSCTDCSNWVR